MDAIKAIMTRRSIRHYTNQPVSQELIEKILRGAMAAPSASNEQSWQFVVIDDREKSGGDVAALKRRTPGKHLVEHDADAE